MRVRRITTMEEEIRSNRGENRQLEKNLTKE